jgi:hypothetical protein
VNSCFSTCNLFSSQLPLALFAKALIRKSSTSIIESRHLSTSENLSLGFGGPDCCASVKNDVPIVLDSEDDSTVTDWGSIRLPRDIAFGVTTHNPISQNESPGENNTPPNITRKEVREAGNSLNAEVAIFLHLDTFTALRLLGSVLECAYAIIVNANLAILLHPELGFAVFAKKALACKKPLAISEGVVCPCRHFECGVDD